MIANVLLGWAIALGPFAAVACVICGANRRAAMNVDLDPTGVGPRNDTAGSGLPTRRPGPATKP